MDQSYARNTQIKSVDHQPFQRGHPMPTSTRLFCCIDATITPLTLAVSETGHSCSSDTTSQITPLLPPIRSLQETSQHSSVVLRVPTPPKLSIAATSHSSTSSLSLNHVPRARQQTVSTPHNLLLQFSNFPLSKNISLSTQFRIPHLNQPN